jgi:hypothetical protein
MALPDEAQQLIHLEPVRTMTTIRCPARVMKRSRESLSIIIVGKDVICNLID